MVAPLPVATMIDMGVARPRAQGQAMINTDTAAISAWANLGSGPKKYQTTNATRAMAITAGTKYPDTTSASFWIGARLRWDSATILTICDRTVSAPTF